MKNLTNKTKKYLQLFLMDYFEKTIRFEYPRDIKKSFQIIRTQFQIEHGGVVQGVTKLI